MKQEYTVFEGARGPFVWVHGLPMHSLEAQYGLYWKWLSDAAPLPVGRGTRPGTLPALNIVRRPAPARMMPVVPYTGVTAPIMPPDVAEALKEFELEIVHPKEWEYGVPVPWVGEAPF